MRAIPTPFTVVSTDLRDSREAQTVDEFPTFEEAARFAADLMDDACLVECDGTCEIARAADEFRALADKPAPSLPLTKDADEFRVTIVRGPRCYHEYCSTPATHHLIDYGNGKTGPFNPAKPVYEYRGVFGYCDNHPKR